MLPDAYSTDGELLRYSLRVLDDNKSYFPAYRAAPLARTDLSTQVRSALLPLVNLIDDLEMQRLNAEVVVQGKSFQAVADVFITSRSNELGLDQSQYESVSWQQELWGHFLRHIQLTGVALLGAIIVGLGLSLLIYSNTKVANAVVYACGLMQTVPSLALLALMIPIFWYWRTACHCCLVPLFASANCAQCSDSVVRSRSNLGQGLTSTWFNAVGAITVFASTFVYARYLCRHSHRGSHQYWYCDTGGVHRCRWVRRAYCSWTVVE